MKPLKILSIIFILDLFVLTTAIVLYHIEKPKYENIHYKVIAKTPLVGEKYRTIHYFSYYILLLKDDSSKVYKQTVTWNTYNNTEVGKHIYFKQTTQESNQYFDLLMKIISISILFAIMCLLTSALILS